MFQRLWQYLGFTSQDVSKYDAVYGLPKQAVAEWLQGNPQFAAEWQARERQVPTRRDYAAGRHGTR